MRLFEIEDNELDLIGKYCQPFLEQSEYLPLYRGLAESKSFVIKTVRNDREPRDTPKIIHNLVDEWFKQHDFTANRSNSIFCSGHKTLARRFGIEYQIFPMGDFSFTWSPQIYDLTVQHFKVKRLPQLTNFSHEEYSDVIDQATKAGETARNYFLQHIIPEKVFNVMNQLSYKSTNLVEAIESGREIMLHCEKYIAVKAEIKYRDMDKNEE